LCRALLAEKLLQSQREVEIREQKFQRFAERADVAIFIALPTGQYIYRNQRWFDLFPLAESYDDMEEAWSKIVGPDDIKVCDQQFVKLVVKQESVCFELKTKIPWTPPKLEASKSEPQTHFVWILCSCYPELDALGRVKEVVGCITDSKLALETPFVDMY
jgi:PAS domain-containing protein